MKDLPKDDLEKQKILQEIAIKFEKDREYSEVEVNEIIKKDFEDFALIRRELLNFGYFGKDSHKSVYWVVKYKLSSEELAKISKNQKGFEEGGVY